MDTDATSTAAASESAQALISALADLATPRLAMADQAADLERRRERWVGELAGWTGLWLTATEDDRVEIAYGERHVTEPPDLEEVWDALRSYVDGAEPDWARIPTKVIRMGSFTGRIDEYDIEAWLADRSEIDTDMAEAASKIAVAKERLDAAFSAVRARLTTWLDDVLSGAGATPAEWGRIQKAWRAALALPMREAANLLAISSAAVARYETNSRTPSLGAIRMMVDRLIDVEPTAGLDVEVHIRVLSQMEGFAHITREDWIGGDEDPSLIASIEDRLPDLGTRQLRFLDGLLADRDALDQLVDWLERAPTRLLGTAATSVAAR